MDIAELHEAMVQGFASLNDKIDSGLAALGTQMDADFGRVQNALMEQGRQLKEIRTALDRKVDRDELDAPH